MVKDRGAWHPAVRGVTRVRCPETQRLVDTTSAAYISLCRALGMFGVSPGKMRSLPDSGRKFTTGQHGSLEIMGALDGKPIVLGRKCFTKASDGSSWQLQLTSFKACHRLPCTGGDLFSSGSFQILMSWTDICFKISLVLP